MANENKGRSRTTDLGLIKFATVNAMPSNTQMPETTMYAMPRKGFRPPITVVVEMTIDLVPP